MKNIAKHFAAHKKHCCDVQNIVYGRMQRASRTYLRSTGGENDHGCPVRIPSSGACPGVLLHVCGLRGRSVQARVPRLRARCMCANLAPVPFSQPLASVLHSGGRYLKGRPQRKKAPWCRLAPRWALKKMSARANPTLEVPENHSRDR